MMPQMIIANRLIDGRVVFLAPAGQWDTAIAAGTVIDDPVEAERLLQVAKEDQARCIVIDPMLIQVRVDNGLVRPTEIREAIRAFGPTVRTDVENAGSIVGVAPEADRRAEGITHLRRSTKE
jgi:sulfite reductase (NADPH) hemoprotein beta-component